MGAPLRPHDRAMRVAALHARDRHRRGDPRDRRSRRASMSAPDAGTPLERALLVAAAVYLALIPVGAMTAIRSIAFATAAVLALAVVLEARRGRAAAIPLPGRLLTFAVVAIVAWSALSFVWSVRRDYTLQEFRGELVWNALTIVIFYVAAGVRRAWPVLSTTALASFAVSASIALGVPLVQPGRSADFWYGDAGYFSTLIVLMAPIALTVPERSPRRAAAILSIALLALALAAARETQNRIVFIALAAVFALAAGLAALRWRSALARAPMRWAIALVALAVALGALFVDAAREKAQRDFPPQTTIAQTLADDPRLPLCDVTAQRIRERPWAGYGYGRAILAPELRAVMGSALFEHPHNTIASQWLQTGAIGVALLALLLAALVGRALLAGFVIKNMTDDFLYRSGAREFFALNALLIGWAVRRAALCRV